MIEHRHTWVFSPGRQWRTCKFCGEQQQYDGNNWQKVGVVTVMCG